MSLEIRTQGQSATQDITADGDFSDIEIGMEQRLDIACGKVLQTGWTGMDIAEVSVPAGAKYIHHDVLSFPWPIEDNSVYEARCSHFVEHIPHQLEGYSKYKNGMILFMEELYRVLMPQGFVTITCPYYSSERAWQDPTHVRAITKETFKYFDPKWLEAIGMDHYDIKTDFEVVTTKMIMDPSCEGRSESARQMMMRHFGNTVMDIQVVLRKRGK